MPALLITEFMWQRALVNEPIGAHQRASFQLFFWLVDDVNLSKKTTYAFATLGFDGKHLMTVLQSKKARIILCVFSIVML